MMVGSKACSRAMSAVKPVYRHSEYRAAIESIQDHAARLLKRTRRAGERCIADQDHLCQTFLLRPRTPTASPLLLMGGMGPSVGAEAFERACRRFRDERTILLYQACNIPDRTAVIELSLASEGLSIPEERDLIDLLLDALKVAVRPLQGAESISCIFVCNSVHFFLPVLKQRLSAESLPVLSRLRIVSLIEVAVEKARCLDRPRLLVMATTGSVQSRLFGAPLSEAGVEYVYPPAELQAVLMRAIYDGVKVFDDETAFKAGRDVLTATLRYNSEVNCILAGCTEMPHILKLVRQRAGPDLTRKSHHGGSEKPPNLA